MNTGIANKSTRGDMGTNTSGWVIQSAGPRLQIEGQNSAGRMRLGVLALLAVLLPVSLAAQTSKPWHFAVAGDSRNCGDVVMPAIAESVKKDQAMFYWHLGDMRWITDIDQDMANRKQPPPGKYPQNAWDDFIDHQVKPFDPVQVWVGIGNHETYLTKDRKQFVDKFRKWLPEPSAYYHFVKDGVDFIYLDNATDEQFDKDQFDWFTRLLERDNTDASVRTLVVGMHKALPNSFAGDHSMNEADKTGKANGDLVYEELLKARDEHGKLVYLLASHSHYYSPGLYTTREKVLDGWIIGTAGAQRYKLPANAPKDATNEGYGYLLATVNPSGAPPGTIAFKFQPIEEKAALDESKDNFTPDFVHWCYANNKK